MRNNISKNLKMILVLALMTFCANIVQAGKGPVVITKEQLMGMMHQPDLIILDVRTRGNWQESATKIQGAKREMPSKFNSWAYKYPEDNLLVLY